MVVLLYAGLVSLVVFGWHTIPLYGVETDLFGDAIPAARAIVGGADLTPHFQFKGPGYPLLLVAATPLAGGDEWLAARLLNALAAVAGAWGSYLLARRLLGGTAGLIVLLGVAVNPTYWQAAIEAGTDLPAFALSVWSTHWALGSGVARSVGAGLFAGFAIVTRYNAAFLLPAAAATLAFRPRRWRSLLAYGAGAAVPLAAWAAWQGAVTGDPFGNRNYLNLAYTFYGQGRSWEGFWTESAGSFTSLADVLAYDPGTVARTVWGNVLGHWRLDATQLVGLPLGAVGVAGLLLAVPGRAGSFACLVHYALAYLSLAFVFYSPRFFLYLLPLYLLGAAALLVRGHDVPLWRNRSRLPAPVSGSLRWGGLVAAALILAASGRLAWDRVESLIANPLVEIPAAARVLREYARPGDRLVARKPQIAHFAGLEFEPFPAARTLSDLLSAARSRGADYLYFSGIEARFRPHLRSLIEASGDLPGLERIASQTFDEDSYFQLFRFTGQEVTPAEADRALFETHRRYVSRHPEDVEAMRLLGEMWLAQGEPAEALQFLEGALHRYPSDISLLTSKSFVEYRLGDLPAAEASVREALAARPDHAWANAFLGQLLLDRGRPAEAEVSLERALERDPARPSYRFLLGTARVRLGEYGAAVEEYLRVLQLEPKFPGARAAAARALAWAGQRQRALALLTEVPAGLPGAEQAALQALADSLRASDRPAPPERREGEP